MEVGPFGSGRHIGGQRIECGGKIRIGDAKAFASEQVFQSAVQDYLTPPGSNRLK